MEIFNILRDTALRENIHTLVVGGIILDDQGRILLLKRANNEFMKGFYEFPSGRMGLGETIDKCLVRNVEEETGLSVKNIDSYVGSFDYLSDMGKVVRQYNFVIKIENFDKVKLSNEHSEYKFLKLSDCETLVDISDEILYTISVIMGNRLLKGDICK